jgi:hypothetical protein
VTFRVVVTREGDSWLADVPDVEGAHTWARNLPALDQAVREVIALAEDLPDGAEDGLAIDYDYRTGDVEIDRTTADLRASRARIEAESRRLEASTAAAARRLAKTLSVRDTATLLGVSPQRISQLAPKDKAA